MGRAYTVETTVISVAAFQKCVEAWEANDDDGVPGSCGHPAGTVATFLADLSLDADASLWPFSSFKRTAGFMIAAGELKLANNQVPISMPIPSGGTCFQPSAFYGVWESVPSVWTPTLAGPTHEVVIIRPLKENVLVIDAGGQQFTHLPADRRHFELWVPCGELA